MNERTTSRPTRHASLLGASLFIAILAAACGAAEKEKEPVVEVTAAAPEREEISQLVSAEAVVYPVQQSVITPKITSTIREFLVQRGSKVHKGQLLAVLENADLAAAAQQSKGEFEQAEATYSTTVNAGVPQQMQKAQLDLAAAKAGYDAQQKVYDSRKDLFAQGALPRRDLDTAEVALAQARAQYEVAEKQLADLNKLGEREALKSADGQMAAAKGKYLGSKAALSYSEIRSPLNGVVTDRPQYAGELAAANQPLMTLMDLSKLIAKAHISRLDAASLKVGDVAELRTSGSDDTFHGRVSLVSPALDAGSTTVEIWVEVAKPGDKLKPGMTAQVSIVAKTLKDALVVPTSALFKDAEDAHYVMLAGSDNHAHQKIVKVGIRNADDVQIVDGLTATDRVIVSGGYGLPDKAQIKLQEPGAAKDDDDKAAPARAAKPKAPDKD
ncbi:MAG TPA: efflux RND transporter periplasmic adaptor subunit [Candidatus Acidoferrum sp.]|jgi:multidrug efflux pump subunit AcrA (membrane-fusion protein)